MVNLLDIILIPIAYSYVFGIIYLASYLKAKARIDGSLARKIVHLGIGIMVILAPLLFSSNEVPTVIGLTFILITFFTSPISPMINWRLSAFKDGHGLGTVYYSISLTLLLYYFFPTGWIIQVSFLPLVFGDAFANIIGIRYGKHKWFNSKKSIEGTLAGIIACWIIVILALFFYYFMKMYPGTIISIFVIGLLAALIMAVIELISPYGLDNLTIPLGCCVLAINFQQYLI